MNEYTIYLRVVNSWTTPIWGSVTYFTAGWPPLIIPFAGLAPGASTPEFALVTNARGLDYWSYTMQDASNHAWSGQLPCALSPEEDGKIIDCVFDAASSELRVTIPGSTTCVDALSGYVGFMQVRNDLEGGVSGWVMHQTTEYGTSLISFENLDRGEESERVAITSAASSLDRWHYCVTWNGITYRGVHKCGFSPEYRTLTAILEFGMPREEMPAIKTVMPNFSSCYTRLVREVEETPTT